MRIINFIMSAQGVEIILAILGVASLIATMTANKVDNKVINVLLKLINVLGGNYGTAKNKDND